MGLNRQFVIDFHLLKQYCALSCLPYVLESDESELKFTALLYFSNVHLFPCEVSRDTARSMCRALKIIPALSLQLIFHITALAVFRRQSMSI